MSGIKDLAVLIHWRDNSLQSTLEASFLKKRKVPRERQLILKDLNEAMDGAAAGSGKKLISAEKLGKNKLNR